KAGAARRNRPSFSLAPNWRVALRSTRPIQSSELSLRGAQRRSNLLDSKSRRNAMPLRSKVVITCAVTGSIHTPTMSPYLPLTPDEVARDAIAAAEAGAAILHLHARDPKDGRP